MKNPLTPIRFAVAQLSRSATAEQKESLEVLTAEAARLEALAREFREFGRLPEGPAAEVDLGELLAELGHTAYRQGWNASSASIPRRRGSSDITSRCGGRSAI